MGFQTCSLLYDIVNGLDVMITYKVWIRTLSS